MKLLVNKVVGPHNLFVDELTSCYNSSTSVTIEDELEHSNMDKAKG